MIISKKNLEKLIQQRVAEELHRREYENYINDRFMRITERIYALEEKINPDCKTEESAKPTML